jgi:tetratricopeptide (TPR) repeat protein
LKEEKTLKTWPKILLAFILILSIVTFASCKTPIQSHIDKANTLYDEGKWDACITECTAALDLKPGLSDEIKASITRAAAYTAKGQYTEAIKDCTTIIDKDPQNTMAYYQRSMDYIYNSEYDKALADCNKVIALGMTNNFAYYNRGAAYAHKGELDMALADLNKALKLTPEGEMYQKIDTYIKQIEAQQAQK